MVRRWRAVCRGVTAVSRGGAWNKWVTLIVAVTLCFGLIRGLQSRLRPLTAAAVELQIHDQVTQTIQDTAATELARLGTGYSDLVTVQRDESGHILGLTTDTAAMTRLQSSLTSAVLEAVGGLRTSALAIPVGSLTGSDLMWGRGPAIQVRSLWVGTVEAAFESELDSAGVNQTRHRLWLEFRVPVRAFLPGGPVETTVDTRFLTAETVIVGQVPDTYLSLN